MTSTKRQETRNEIISVTEKLLSSVGRDTVTIRTIADLAKVQAPTIYRIFGDKVGLLNAVAEEGFARYMTIKPEFDSSLGIIEELRKGWDIHVEFGIEHPELYKLMFGDSYAGLTTSAARIAFEGFDEIMDRMDKGGYLSISKEEAIFRSFASASGVVLSILSLPKALNQHTFVSTVREDLIAKITTEPAGAA